MAWAFDNRTVGFRVVGQGNPSASKTACPAPMPIPISRSPRCSPRAWRAWKKNSIAANVTMAMPTSIRSWPACRAHFSKPPISSHGSELARNAFGNEVVDFYVHTARLEVQAYNNVVTDWEKQRYFERI